MNRFQVFFVFKNVLRSELRSNGHLGQNGRSQPSIPYPFDVDILLLLFQNSGIGYQYLTNILGLGINIGPNFLDWVAAEIFAAHIPVWIYSEVPPPGAMACVFAVKLTFGKCARSLVLVLFSEQVKFAATKG